MFNTQVHCPFHCTEFYEQPVLSYLWTFIRLTLLLYHLKQECQYSYYLFRTANKFSWRYVFYYYFPRIRHWIAINIFVDSGRNRSVKIDPIASGERRHVNPDYDKCIPADRANRFSDWMPVIWRMLLDLKLFYRQTSTSITIHDNNNNNTWWWSTSNMRWRQEQWSLRVSSSQDRLIFDYNNKSYLKKNSIYSV